MENLIHISQELPLVPLSSGYQVEQSIGPCYSIQLKNCPCEFSLFYKDRDGIEHLITSSLGKVLTFKSDLDVLATLMRVSASPGTDDIQRHLSVADLPFLNLHRIPCILRLNLPIQSNDIQAIYSGYNIQQENDQDVIIRYIWC